MPVFSGWEDAKTKEQVHDTDQLGQQLDFLHNKHRLRISVSGPTESVNLESLKLQKLKNI